MAEVMARLEEKDKNQEGSLAAMEKDLALKLQAVETFKKKVECLHFKNLRFTMYVDRHRKVR